ncbi:MAG: UDP-N-acetylmuramate--alanine ligase [Elusimicrobia bacterium]|nr:UDP-N-acetylmuramate--alanine ligase [Elusimicrobiota bacterium]MDE2237364.1 UDP-N-acetylmuramate--alanine ligase [Elusimicrobiota bacterium]MDE2426649.1 UDP-N-acetylmuramate--alanine ligase [Elusimicrobiota bacterium]
MGRSAEKLHFVGVAGNGMSALAQLRAWEGCTVSGSDRLADRGSLGQAGQRLSAAGVSILPQDGSGVSSATARVVVSSAIEEGNPDLLRAAALGVPLVHRADELASFASARKTVAVAGTSGKSTVTAMLFHILSRAKREPSVAAGAALTSLRREGLLGNAWLGKSELLVLEADESDGSIGRYHPFIGLLLNLSKDHKELGELMALFSGFKAASESFIVSADAPGLDELRPGAMTYGFRAGELRGRALSLGTEGSRFEVEGVEFRLPLVGAHNADNALAAVAAATRLGVGLAQAAEALAGFRGVHRRFERVGQAGGVEVVDDFAHNPEKVRAALAAAHLRARRVLAVFQLHGFAPARFLKKEFIAAFLQALGPEDVLWLPDIYYAGGTAAKDVSARDYAEALLAAGKNARHAPERSALPLEIAASAKAGDLVLIMGARDPSLPELAAEVLAALRRRF